MPLGVTYYRDDPPDEVTIAQIRAAGGTVDYIDRPAPSTPAQVTVVAPYDPSFPGTLEDCAYQDTECVLRRVAAVTDFQRNYSLQNAQDYYEQGMRDWRENKARYEALGLPVPPPPTLEQYIAANAPRNEPAPAAPAGGGKTTEPGGKTAQPVNTVVVTTPPSPGAPSSGSITDKLKSVPWWGWLAGAGAILTMRGMR